MKKKVLITEDNPQNMRLLEMTLRSGDYTLLKATDGKQALDMIATEHPDMVIMDIQLPGLSGYEVIKELRQMPGFETMTVIALTAYAMKGDREKYLAAGCDAYISKPINTRELPKMIDRMLAGETLDNP